MKHWFFSVAVLIVSLASTGFGQKNETHIFTAGGKTHSCIWHVPSGIDKPPVVFFIHGAFGSGENFQKETKADAVADKEKFIAVYPSATSNGATGTWADMSGVSDYPFYLAVLDTLNAKYKIDRDKVYMTGFSQGGFISFVAGCSYSNIFAAIAPVSGHAGSNCSIKRPVPVYLTFGATEDKVAFIKDLTIWQKLDSCPSSPTITRPTTGVTRVTYGPCAQGTYVIMDSISGQGHQWPNKQNQADEVWKFFKQFSLKSTTATQQQAVPAVTRVPISVSYTSGTVHIQGTNENCLVRVIDTRGRQIATATKHQFAFKNRTSGVYILMVYDKNGSLPIRMVLP